MTVGDLMRQLERLDPSLEVVVPSRTQPEHGKLTGVRLDQFYARRGGLILTDHRDADGMFTAVKLMADGETV